MLTASRTPPSHQLVQLTHLVPASVPLPVSLPLHLPPCTCVHCRHCQCSRAPLTICVACAMQEARASLLHPSSQLCLHKPCQSFLFQGFSPDLSASCNLAHQGPLHSSKPAAATVLLPFANSFGKSQHALAAASSLCTTTPVGTAQKLLMQVAVHLVYDVVASV